MTPSGPSSLLASIRIVDVTSVLMGPYATQMLADMGADVIYIEPPGPSAIRSLGPGRHPDLPGMALNLLRNKRSVQLDLAAAAGREALLRLVATADVFVTNLRPRSLERLALTYDDVVASRSDIVYCEAHGYPSDSRRRDDAAYDDVIQAGSGLVDTMRLASGEDRYVPTVLADKVCGLLIAQAVCAALVRRRLDGRPVWAEIAMAEAMRSFVLTEHGAGAIPRPPVSPAGYRRVLTPARRPFPTLDGVVCALPYGPGDWRAIFDAAGRTELADDRIASRISAIEHAESLYGDLASILSTRTTAECLAQLGRVGVAVSEVARLDRLVEELPDVEHPVAGVYKYLPTGVRVDGEAPVVPARPAPTRGEHTVELLASLGLTDAQIAAAAGEPQLPEAPGHWRQPLPQSGANHVDR